MKTDERVMKVWMLRPKDPMEPPFHFVGVPQAIAVLAAGAKAARAQAARSGPEMAPAGLMVRDGRPTVTVEERSPWLDPDLTSCEEADMTEPCVLARAMA